MDDTTSNLSGENNGTNNGSPTPPTHSIEQTLFEYAVPYNHPLLVASRRKMFIFVAVFMLSFGAFCAAVGTIFLSDNEVTGGAVFLGLGLFMLVISLLQFLCIKPRKKYDGKNINFAFLDFGMNVEVGAGFGKRFASTRCLYNKRIGKQFVSNIIEMDNVFMFKVYYGTVNGAPQYKKFYLPKDIVEEKQEIDQLKTFLMQQKENKYKVKEKILK